jgi:DNA ligase-4
MLKLIPYFSCSQSSLITDSSATRHLALVFFDILVLDSTSFLSTPYCDRRSLLESIITPIPGQAMLADRTAIEINGDEAYDIEQAEKDLRRLFAKTIADHQEGLLLKADDGVYRDSRVPWVKLKKDYIPGYGDSVDLVVLCAGWDKARARELRGWF